MIKVIKKNSTHNSAIHPRPKEVVVFLHYKDKLILIYLLFIYQGHKPEFKSKNPNVKVKVNSLNQNKTSAIDLIGININYFNTNITIHF
jgi:hypothetical protein